MTQLELLVAKLGSRSPLFLATACEELRLQAQYGITGEGVTNMIASLPQTIPGVLGVVLDRIENDLGEWLASLGLAFVRHNMPASAAEAEAAERAATEARDGSEAGTVAGTAARRGRASGHPGGRAAVAGSGQRSPTRGVGQQGTGKRKGAHRWQMMRRFRRAFRGLVRRTRSGEAAAVSQALVKWMLCLLVCSREGLTEAELRDLLRSQSENTLPIDVWLR